MSHIELFTIIVDTYDEAIAYFVDVLGFDLIEDYGRVAVFVDICGNRWDLLGS